MNWGYLLTRAGIAGVLWAFFAFGFDPLVRRGLILTGETALGGRVDVAQIDSTFRSPTLRVSDVRVANRDKPGTNLVEFDRLEARLDGPSLLRKKYVVEEATLEGLRWNTPRTDSGVIEGWEPLSKRVRGEWIPGVDLDFHFDLKLDDEARAFGREVLDDFMKRARGAVDPHQLESYRVARELQKVWPDRFEDLKHRVDPIDDRARAIRKEAASVKGSTLDRIKAYAHLLEDANQLLADIEQIRSELVALPTTARTDFATLNAAKDRDLKRLSTKIEMVRLDGEGLSDLLLGPSLKEQIRRTATFVDHIRRVAASAPVDVEPVRMRGLDIAFPERNPVPRFLVRSLKVSGETTFVNQPFQFAGTVTDVTDDPRLHGKPVTVTLEGSGPFPVNLTATVDRTSDQPLDQIEIAWVSKKPTTLQFGNQDCLALEVAAERTSCRTTFVLRGGHMEGEVQWSQSPVKVAMKPGTHATTPKTLHSSEAVPAGSNDPAATPSPIRTALAEGGRPALADRLDAVTDSLKDATTALPEDLLCETLAHVVGSVDAIDASLRFSRLDDGQMSISIDSELGPHLANGLKTGLMDAIDSRREQLQGRLDEELLQQATELRTMMGLRYKEVLGSLDLRENELKSLAAQLTHGEPIQVTALKPVKTLRESKAVGDAEKLLKGDVPQNPKDLEHIRKDVRDIKNDFKSLRDARNLLRK